MGGGGGWLQDPLPLPLPPDRPVDADADWRGVRERVIAVLEAEGLARGRAPSRYPVFGPALTAGEIAGAGAQCGVAFPGGYRSFLAQVGAGGPGPELRLTSLRRVGGRWRWVWDTVSDQLCVLDPGGPFTETADWAGHLVFVRASEPGLVLELELAARAGNEEATAAMRRYPSRRDQQRGGAGGRGSRSPAGAGGPA